MNLMSGVCFSADALWELLLCRCIMGATCCKLDSARYWLPCGRILRSRGMLFSSVPVKLEFQLISDEVRENVDRGGFDIFSS